MVKSYKGVFHKDEGPSKTDRYISDYMTTNIITFTPEDSVYDAMQTLLKHRISGAPVVDDKGALIGVLSEGDCLKEIVKGQYDNRPNQTGKVGDHMTTNVTTISKDMTILDAANFFLSRRFRRFPVVNDGKLVGLITQTDLMRAVNDLD
ncbi:CBS domain-containing protein [bacterium]|nr:CBS domain-containing protein [bacterium]